MNNRTQALAYGGKLSPYYIKHMLIVLEEENKITHEEHISLLNLAKKNDLELVSAIITSYEQNSNP